MNWLDKLERKFGRYAIHNLMYYIIILYVVGLVVQLFAPSFYYQYLSLDVNAILHGQIWRVVTFIIQPPPEQLHFHDLCPLSLLYAGQGAGTHMGRIPF